LKRLPVVFAGKIELRGKDLEGANMTLRMEFAWVAIAALGLIMSDLSAARALSFCDVNPDRCRYSPSGKGYYYPRGLPMPQGLDPAFVERPRTANAASGQAWGCAATDGTSRVPAAWGYASRAAAVAGAIEACQRGSTSGSCRIVGCRSGVRSRDEARALWLHTSHR
jgi:hypothetical protein